MAKSVLDILIKLSKQGNADKDTVRGLVQVKSAMMDAAAVAGTFVAAGYTIKKAYDATVQAVIAYADQVRATSDMTDLSAEDSSRLIQVLDDLKISYEDLEKVIQKNGKTYDFSINGLARMSEEYLKLTDTQEKSAFMQERFGKQWGQWVQVMEKGPDVLLAMNDAVDENLVLTQKQVDLARENQILIDELTDSWQGLMYVFGNAALPEVNENLKIFLSYLKLNQTETEKTQNKWAGWLRIIAPWISAFETLQDISLSKHAVEIESIGAAADYADRGERALVSSVTATSLSLQEQEEAAKELSKTLSDMLGLTEKISSEERNYADTVADLTQKQAEVKAEMEQLYPWEVEKLEELKQKYDEYGVKIDEAAAKHHEAMGKIQYDLLVTKLSADGLTQSEYQIAQQAGLMFGVFDQESLNAAQNMDLVAQAVSNGTLKVQDMQRALDMLKNGYSIDVVLNVIAQQAGTFSLSGRREHVGMERRAGGGPVSAGSPYMVGEHGIEMFVPSQDGMVVPNSSIGGSPIYVSLTISSPVTIMDQQNAQNVLLPFIINGVRQAKAQGAIK